MANTIMISLTDEAKSCLEKKKEENPNFNFSGFVQSKLLETQENKEDPEKLKLILIEKNALIKQTKEEINLFENQLAKLEAEEKLQVERKAQEIAMQERNKTEFVQRTIKNAQYFFEITEEDAELVAWEILETPKAERKTLLDLLKSRGYREKEEKELK